MAKRKPITKKTRFEVFKRDSFTCQYCGSKSPESILEVDHITPVSKGGKNEIMNLITSCFDCNRGKSDREISDNSVLEKQRIQIEELNLRRQQLEMMLEWRDGVKSIEDESLIKAIDYFNNKFNDYTLNEHGESILKKYTKKYGIINVLNQIDIVCDKYYSANEEEYFEICLKKLGAFLSLSTKPEHEKKIAYIKGIVRNKFYINERIASIELKNYYENGYCLDDLTEKLKSNYFNHWTDFKNYITL